MNSAQPRACETEALVWATMGEMPPPDLSGLLRRLARALLPVRAARIPGSATA